jgi:hypothetical protein
MTRRCKRWQATKAAGCSFWVLGTGLGSAMIVDGILEPMELAHLPYKKKSYEDYLGLRGLKRFGKKKWQRQVADAVEQLREALEAEHVVLGGGNAEKLKTLPPSTRLGDNRSMFVGGFRLWEPAAARHRQYARPQPERVVAP